MHDSFGKGQILLDRLKSWLLHFFFDLRLLLGCSYILRFFNHWCTILGLFDFSIDRLNAVVVTRVVLFRDHVDVTKGNLLRLRLNLAKVADGRALPINQAKHDF